jgi:hypothetical protein
MKAVGIGEQITGRVEVTGVPDDKPICTLEPAFAPLWSETCLVARPSRIPAVAPAELVIPAREAWCCLPEAPIPRFPGRPRQALR